MKRTYIQFIAFLFIFLISISTTQNPYTSNYISDLKDDSETVSKQIDALYKEIDEKAKAYEKEPIDAEINKVWKATPGYNGLKVDVDASYKKMKKSNKFDEHKLVYKQVSPKVHLDDLPPEAIYRGNPEKPMVSFLINVAWGNEYIPDMLETLKKHKVKATFFLEGRWVKENPDLAKMIVSAGHEVGNHSYTHPNLKTLSSSSVVDQLSKTNDVIEATTGEKPSLFAPPAGNYRDEVVKIAANQGMKTIMWSVDTIDWQRPEPHVLVQRVMGKVHPGALILMHPTSSTAKALETLILSIKQKEYIIHNVSTLLSEDRVINK
ncbi:polysaccharide deacetylase family protein [Litchfieldia salsa]|uniref:Probable sporulation protein, polysaccharide deacetylase family n=1 Tax=Litchfieldia salsa TaxID=930152 RepID=A0A1H0R3V9_9BACI|nr:polysaccharide deacetylase family protein [Litchfieldia salsa]SDP24167.1 probable sporulation protein, polysaccharide deacetylase family [Litchfieldia salsa]